MDLLRLTPARTSLRVVAPHHGEPRDDSAGFVHHKPVTCAVPAGREINNGHDDSKLRAHDLVAITENLELVRFSAVAPHHLGCLFTRAIAAMQLAVSKSRETLSALRGESASAPSTTGGKHGAEPTTKLVIRDAHAVGPNTKAAQTYATDRTLRRAVVGLRWQFSQT